MSDRVHEESKRAATAPPASDPQPAAEQTEKRRGGATKGNANAVTHGLNRATKRTRAVNEDEYDRQGRREAAALYDRGDPRRKLYAATWGAWARLKARLDMRGWTLPSGEAKNAVQIWTGLNDKLDKMQAERRREQDGAPAEQHTYRACFSDGVEVSAAVHVPPKPPEFKRPTTAQDADSEAELRVDHPLAQQQRDRQRAADAAKRCVERARAAARGKQHIGWDEERQRAWARGEDDDDPFAFLD